MKAEVIIFDEVGIEIERQDVIGNVWGEIQGKADFLFDTCENPTKDFYIINEN